MLIAALLLCSLIRALPPACNRHDTANNAPSPEPVEVSRPVDNSAARIAPSPSLDAQNAISPPPSSAPIDSSSFQRLSTPPTSDSDCKCGYTLSAHSNAYFPSAHIVSFSSLPNGPLSISDLTNLGFEVNNQHQVGGVYKGTKSVGSINALSGQDGALAMTVKGGQAMGGDIEAAEIIFQPEGGMTGGVFGMEAVFDPTPGTCQAMFTYNMLQGAPGDEQDIEILGHTIFDKMPNGTPPGIQLTNWDPAGSETSDHVIVPFIADPTTGYHNYT